jgi:hypothetical protein
MVFKDSADFILSRVAHNYFNYLRLRGRVVDRAKAPIVPKQGPRVATGLQGGHIKWAYRGDIIKASASRDDAEASSQIDSVYAPIYAFCVVSGARSSCTYGQLYRRSTLFGAGWTEQRRRWTWVSVADRGA